MKHSVVAILFVALMIITDRAKAQDNYNANWVWADTGNPAEDAPAGKVWFRREVRATQPSTGAIRMLCDDRFVLWVNGQRVGKGEGQKLYRFNLNGIVGRGLNVVAVETENQSGKAGLYVDGEVRGQGGQKVPFDSGKEWKAVLKAPAGDAWRNPRFDEKDWQAVKVLGPHAESPWKAITLKDTYRDRYALAPGFKLERIAEPDLVGSLVAMAWGNRGRLIVSRERGPILNLIDEDDDGIYEKVVEYSNKVTNCQGVCMVFDDLYAAGNGPDGTGLYRLPDNDHDDVADSVELVLKHKGGMGDHGPHDIVFGPDGWLYHNMGNHAWVMEEPQPTTPVRDSYEGHLLEPKFEDANGHASGIKVPGGTIWRFTPDGKKWWCETAGFRNEYDFAFNSMGDMFSFDSDMEWDVGMPWYRPIRVTHCIPGAEFGWRSGCAKWPTYYFDSLPGTVATGRGSPTGVVFYEHRQLPKKYQGGFIICDWSMGRIMLASLKPDGSTFSGDFENIATGNPLNVSDIDVDRDGSIVFCTGGRRTEGGVYRITYPEGQTSMPAQLGDNILDLPQMQTAWAQEIVARTKAKNIDKFSKDMLEAARNGSAAHQVRALTLLSQHAPQPDAKLLIELTHDDDESVRAFAVWLLGGHQGADVEEALTDALGDDSAAVKRRACEAFVRSGIEPPVAPLLKSLGSDDRWLRFAARLSIERVPVEKWKDAVLASENLHVVTHGLLGLYRRGDAALAHDDALRIEADLLTQKRGPLTAELKLEVLRLIELTLIAGGRGPVTGDIVSSILAEYPCGHAGLDTESARILAKLQSHDAAGKVMASLDAATSHAEAIDLALTLRYIDVGWNYDLKQRMLKWYESTEAWEGGHSFGRYLSNIVGAGLDRYRPEERAKLLAGWKERPFAAALLIENSSPEQVSEFETIVGEILDDRSEGVDSAKKERLVNASIEAFGKSDSPAAQQALRKLYDAFPDRRDLLARQLAKSPTAENWPYLVRSLQIGSPTSLQLAVNGLQKTKAKSKEPADTRAIILAALKLNKKTGVNALKLLKAISGSDHKAGKNYAAAVAYYQKWYQDKWPDAPLAVLPTEDLSKTRYSYRQLIDYLETPQGAKGDVERGRKIFAKGKCIKCHRFLKEGDTVGPDLTSVRRRFQRKEVIESLVYPSQVISDQYRMVTIVTEEGLVHNGMPVAGEKDGDKLVLLLADATKIEIPKGEIAEQAVSKVSVMPEGVLKDLTLEEIADLFAFLETSKDNDLTPRDAKVAVK